MVKENMLYSSGQKISHKEKWNDVIYKKMDGTGDHHAEQDKPNLKLQIAHVLTHLWILDLKWQCWK
jgi:hypothetical protein